jgi:hypothetical protein
MANRKFSFLALAAVLLSGVVLAGVAIPNWPAPATWSPSRASDGVRTMGDISSPLPFIGVTPCRQYDSRGTSALPDNTPRAVTITGAPCGLPAAAAAVSLNVTVFDILGQGGNAVFKAGTTSPPTTAWINYPPGQGQIGNAGVLPLNGSGQIVFQVNQGGGSIDFTIDVNGYYASTPATATNYFSVKNSGLYAISGETSNTDPFAAGVYGRATAGPAQGVFGESLSPNNGTAGVFGRATATTGISSGVAGETDSTTNNARGVFGVATATTGVNYGVRGHTNSTTNNASGVFGRAQAASGVTYGVQGLTFSATDATAGVFGGAVSTTGQVIGVLGASQSLVSGFGVAGALIDTGGNPTVIGVLGAATGVAADLTGPPWGVFAAGNLGATGTKHFVEPHPSDPAKVIVYSSLEGREVGTYFRGTSRIVNHQAIIDVPEDFRMVTDEEGLTVQLTSVGASSSMYVESQDLNQIVIKASRDVTFHYLVQGVRRAFKDLEPIRIGYEFVPRSPNDTMPLFLTEEARRRVIANGTYNADGTVNMDTAERLGWAKAWRENGMNTRAAPLFRPPTDSGTADEK